MCIRDRHEHVDHRVHGRLGLPDAHRLDEYHVEARGFAQDDRLACLACHVEVGLSGDDKVAVSSPELKEGDKILVKAAKATQTNSNRMGGPPMH